MAEYKFPAQVNYGWGLSLNMTGKAPAVAKRIFETYEDALAYVNDANDSAIAGLTLAVISDSESEKNGLYFVSKVGTSVGTNDGIIEQVGSQSQIDGSIEKLAISYNSESKKVELKNGEELISSFDASLFVKDGMLDNVSMSGNSMEFTFNTDSGKQKISVPLDKFIDTAANIKLTGYEISSGTSDELVLTAEDSINSAFGKVEKAILDNEEVCSKAFDAVATAIGLNREGMTYVAPEGSNYLTGATSVKDADSKLDAAIKTVSDKIDAEVGKDCLVEVEAGNGITVTEKAASKQTISVKVKSNDQIIELTSDEGIKTKDDAVWDCGTY